MEDRQFGHTELWGGSNPGAVAEVSRLRVDAWRPHIGDVARQRFGIDDVDTRSWHVVLDCAGVAVAAGRVTPLRGVHDLPTSDGYIAHSADMRFPAAIASRLVVHPDHQGRGLGARIIGARLALAARLGFLDVWGETREEQVDGLVAFGYDIVARSADASVPGSWWIMRARLSAS